MTAENIVTTPETQVAAAPAESKTKKASKKAAAEKKPTRTTLGALIGSKNAKFDAALSTKAQNMAELMEAAKVKRSFFNRLKALMGKGLVEKVEEGFYKLTPTGAKLQRQQNATKSAKPAKAARKAKASSPEQGAAPELESAPEQTAAA